MKKIISLTFLLLLLLLLVGCEEEFCSVCTITYKDNTTRTEYLPCDTDIAHYKEWVYSKNTVKNINCQNK